MITEYIETFEFSFGVRAMSFVNISWHLSHSPSPPFRSSPLSSSPPFHSLAYIPTLALVENRPFRKYKKHNTHLVKVSVNSYMPVSQAS